MTDRAEMIRNAFDSMEEESNPQPVADLKDTEHAVERPRDESGKFVATETPVVEKAEAPVVAIPTEYKRPSSWKSDYLPIYDKLAQGQLDQLNAEEAKSLTNYILQREEEAARGINQFKTQAKSYEEALGPMSQALAHHGIDPIKVISQLANTHMTLLNATHEQKLDIFKKMALDYGLIVDNQGEIQPYVPDPREQQLMQYMQQQQQDVMQLKQQVAQAETQRLKNEIARYENDTTNYPYFSLVKNEMAELLEKGLADDIPSAYAKAIRLNESAWEKEQNRLLALATPKVDIVAKKKIATPKSATPKSPNPSFGKRDRLSIISEAYDNLMDSRI